MASNQTTRGTRGKKTKDNIVVVGPNDAGKLPPQALELEEAVLGAIMLGKEAYNIAVEHINDKSFYRVANQRIFQAMQNLAIKEHPIDMITVVDQLKRDGCLEEVGGPLYISTLTSKVSSTAHLKYHCQVLAQKALARELIEMAAAISEKAYNETEDVEDLMGEAEGRIFEISSHGQKRDVTQIDPVIGEAFERMKKAKQNDNNMSGTPSGFTDLDKVTSGWQKSDLIIIAARPAMGKTAFVLSMVRNMAVQYKAPVAMFSLEMSNVQLVNRLIMNVCEIEGEKIRNGKLTNDEWYQMETRITELMGAPIYVDDTPSLSVFELRSKARKLVREHNVQCIIIDYLQLMNASGMAFGSREQEVSIISRNLKGLAKELDIPIIALSQLNRGVEGRTGVDGKRPQLSDLRESGAIEQDADMVCFIHRPEYYFKQGSEGWDQSMIGLAEIIVAKHRNGATKTISLHFDQSHARFVNPASTTPYPRTPHSSARLEGGIPSQQYQSISSSMNSSSMNDNAPMM